MRIIWPFRDTYYLDIVRTRISLPAVGSPFLVKCRYTDLTEWREPEIATFARANEKERDHLRYQPGENH